MSFPSPKKPDSYFPPIASVKIRNAAGGDTFDPGEEVPVSEMVNMIVEALEELDNEQGSTVSEIKRFLTSKKLLNQNADLRPGIILALKTNKIKRPLSAVKAGVYGKYVLEEAESDTEFSLRSPKKGKMNKSSRSGKTNRTRKT
ncbi:histone H1A sperm [Biomphalaria pfeifferi]|uniref:Histone H1A sperm n=1 Tax=Biomphalaria pfeifferi TaxID=112525 RepID=A0AAD8BGA5_BIOPF|nr:histone H1A sperm [Biomphalaria pfeifferi]